MTMDTMNQQRMTKMISDEELIYIAKDQKTYLNTFADGPVLRFGRALEAVISLRYDEMIAELEREVRMVRERVKRLEQENSWLEEANVRLMQTQSSTSNH